MSERQSYNTRPLRLIEQLLESRRGEHMTAEEISSLLKEQGESVGQTTVYRNLEKLCALGKARKFQDGGSACFALADGCAHHFHLRCSVCGKLSHVECDYMENLAHHVSAHHGFMVDSRKTVLHGVCGECAK